MAKRIKAQVQPEISQQQAEELLLEFAAADAEINLLAAEMDKKMAKIRDQYMDKIAPWDDKMKTLQAQLQAYAERNKETLFSKKRSVAMMAGVIGFRNGTPKTKTAKGYTWSAVLELCRAFAPDWIRTKEEPARDLMVAERHQEGKEELLQKIGVEIVSDETFFIEPKREEVAA